MIKTEINYDRPKMAREYPYLGISEEGSIILFTDKRTGGLNKR